MFPGLQLFYSTKKIIVCWGSHSKILQCEIQTEKKKQRIIRFDFASLLINWTTSKNSLKNKKLELTVRPYVFPISIPESSGFFVSAWSPGETLGNSNKYIFVFEWLFRAATYCFAPEIMSHFHSIVPESLQATNADKKA